MRARAWRRFVGRRILVNLKSGHAIAGVLWSAPRGGLLVLKGAELHVDGAASATRLDGEAIIAIGEVDFAQAAHL